MVGSCGRVLKSAAVVVQVGYSLTAPAALLMTSADRNDLMPAPENNEDRKLIFDYDDKIDI